MDGSVKRHTIRLSKDLIWICGRIKFGHEATVCAKDQKDANNKTTGRGILLVGKHGIIAFVVGQECITRR